MLAAAMTSDAKSQIGPAKRDALRGRWSLLVFRMARVLSLFCLGERVPEHTSGVLVFCGDEWNLASERSSIQPRAVLLRRGNLTRNRLNRQIKSEWRSVCRLPQVSAQRRLGGRK
jgi:hypothetical protein